MLAWRVGLWGLRLYLVCALTGMPIMWALASAKIGEREVLSAMLEVDTDLVAAREGILRVGMEPGAHDAINTSAQPGDTAIEGVLRRAWRRRGLGRSEARIHGG